MSIEEVTEWASIFNAYATGRTIQTWEEEKYWVDIDDIDINIINKGLGRVRIKPKIIVRRMTNQELADWLRDEPQEHREWTYEWDDCDCVFVQTDTMSYNDDYAHDECDGKILIRRNHGKWEEPLIEIYD